MKTFRKKFFQTWVKIRSRNSPSIKPLEKFSPKRVKRIVVVSCTALGDTILSIPAIRATRKLFPSAHLCWLIRPPYQELFKSFTEIDTFLLYPGHFHQILSLRSQLKGYDLYLSFHDSDLGPTFLAQLADIPFILRTGLKDAPHRPYLSALVPYRREVHAIEQRLDVLRVLLNEPQKVFDTRLSLPIRPEDEFLAKELLQKKGALAPIMVGFQAKASNPYCEWPLERFAALAQKIVSFFPEAKIILLGAVKDRKALDRLAQLPQVINLAGEIPLSLLPALIKKLHLLVTIDTGPMHVAFAVRTPTVCLFVPSEVRHTGPYQDLHLHQVIRKERPCSPCLRKYCKNPWCMELISVEEVFEAVTKALS